MSIYKLIECSDNYSKIPGSLLQYSKAISAVNNNDNIVDVNECNLTDSFNFKEKIAGEAGDNGTKTVEIMDH